MGGVCASLSPSGPELFAAAASTPQAFAASECCKSLVHSYTQAIERSAKPETLTQILSSIVAGDFSSLSELNYLTGLANGPHKISDKKYRNARVHLGGVGAAATPIETPRLRYRLRDTSLNAALAQIFDDANILHLAWGSKKLDLGDGSEPIEIGASMRKGLRTGNYRDHRQECIGLGIEPVDWATYSECAPPATHSRRNGWCDT